MTKVILVDDHDLVRKGTKSLLEKFPGFKVLAEFSQGEEALRWCRAGNSVDVIVMDIELAGMSGLETIKRLKRMAPEIPIIALTMHIQGPTAQKVIRSGVSGFVGKTSSVEELILAIKTALQGGYYMPSSLAQSLVWDQSQKSTHAQEKLSRLSLREDQMFRHLIRGSTVQKLSEIYTLSAKTIYTYRRRLLKKLEVKNDIELMNFAMDTGSIAMSKKSDRKNLQEISSPTSDASEKKPKQSFLNDRKD